MPTRLEREAALRALDVLLEAAPDALEPKVRRAGLLAALGRNDEARDAYLAILAAAPAHFGALNDLGTLLYATGYRAAARTAYAAAVAHHPDNPMGRVNFANLLLEDGDVAGARAECEAALACDPGHREAHQGLARICAELGDDAAAERHRRLGFHDRFLTALPFRGAGAGTPIMVLVSAAGGNIPTRFLLDDRQFRCWAVVAEFCDPAAAPPPHDLVFNAIGDADLSRPALVAAEALLARGRAPVVNAPAAVLATGRVANAARLAAIPDVAAPLMATVARPLLTKAALAARGFAFPLLLRRPGFHTGRHFLRVEEAGLLPAALAALPGERVTAIQFLEARAADGWVRKYRAMIVDGALYPLHLAIARDWKVHYFTADMDAHPEHRAEEAAFLADMAGVVGARGMAALARIAAVLGLDYGGIDFALGPAGEILLFEANATMVVNPPEPGERWAYRAAPVERILAAVRRMLAARISAAAAP